MGYTRVPNSMTGSDVGIPATHRSSVSIALGQLRKLVTFCCLILVASLLVQGTVWAMATFSDVRYTSLASETAAELVVVEPTPANDEPATLDPLGERVVDTPVPVTADPNRVRSAEDRIMELTATLAGACGRLAAAGLVPLVLLGVLLAAGSATDGVDRTVTAFAWSTITLFLVFPIAANFGMPWADGGLWDYPRLTAILDGTAAAPMSFYLQYAVVPATAMLTTLIAGSRFSAGVAAGLIRGEDFSLDPTLERETAGIKPGSLHGSRNARVMEAFHEPGGGVATGTPVAPAAPPAAIPMAPGQIAAAGDAADGPRLVPGLASPHGVAGQVGPAVNLPPTGTDGPSDPDHGGGPMRTSAGEAPRRLI
jgi:hypothetical protein